jgi:hypothetical protein
MKYLWTLCAALLVFVAGAASASAAPEQWRPFQTSGFVAPAGKFCAFELKGDITKDEEETRVDARYPDGAVRVNEYRGPLFLRFTNTASGKSVVRDLGGQGWEELYPNGVSRKSFTIVGRFSAGFTATDDFPQGYYHFDGGFHVITFDQDGTRHLPVAYGPAENLCGTLSQ